MSQALEPEATETVEEAEESMMEVLELRVSCGWRMLSRNSEFESLRVAKAPGFSILGFLLSVEGSVVCLTEEGRRESIFGVRILGVLY